MRTIAPLDWGKTGTSNRAPGDLSHRLRTPSQPRAGFFVENRTPSRQRPWAFTASDLALATLRSTVSRWIRDEVHPYHPPGDYAALRRENQRRHDLVFPPVRASKTTGFGR
jgi:hypothetical protein